MDPLRIFVGYDPREAVAYHACCNSLIRHSSAPLAITPLALTNLRKEYDERHTDGSNAFIYSRFLVPYLCAFSGKALFLDGDMIVRGDVVELFKMMQVGMDVMVAKHDYQTKHPVKYMGNKNEDYPRKNWSSVILWDCGNYPNRVLLPGYVEKQTGEYLHRFQWIPDQRIGEIPLEWNWLVEEYEHNDNAKLYHYTLGIPSFPEYANCDHADKYWEEIELIKEVHP